MYKMKQILLHNCQFLCKQVVSKRISMVNSKRQIFVMGWFLDKMLELQRVSGKDARATEGLRQGCPSYRGSQTGSYCAFQASSDTCLSYFGGGKLIGKV